MTKYRLAAIGLDAPHDGLFMEWVRAGQLPAIAALLERGVSASVTHQKRYRNERCWETFLSGRDRQGCGAVFLPDKYEYYNESLQRESRYRPFYALGDEYQVCVFDLPVALVPGLRGLQATGWGSELNASIAESVPADLMAELLAKHGGDPKLEGQVGLPIRDYLSGAIERSWRVPSLYDAEALIEFKNRLLAAIERRTNICLDLLGRQQWDLFLGLYAESHTANHVLWHLGEPHPLNAVVPQVRHALLDIFQAIDGGIARISAALPADMHLMVFTVDHTAQNTMDVPSLALLPEWLYRWNFPGRQALAAGDTQRPPPVCRYDYRMHWKHEVWARRTPAADSQLLSPAQLEAEGSPLSWNPAYWYHSLWPQMKAFALPGVSDGHIRVNLRRREAAGIVDPAEYSGLLDSLSALLLETKNPRTGKAAVKSLVRTRVEALDCPDIAPDLIVCWNDDEPMDTLDCAHAGRIGPLPFFRSGGHVAHGTTVINRFFAKGPRLRAGIAARNGRLVDLSASILHLIGASGPQHDDGHSLFDSASLCDHCPNIPL